MGGFTKTDSGNHSAYGRIERNPGQDDKFEGTDFMSESHGPAPQMTGSSIEAQQEASVDNPFMRAAGIR